MVSLDQEGLKKVQNLRLRMVQALKNGVKFVDIGAQLSANSAGVSYRDLGWHSEQIFKEPGTIALMASLGAGSVSPPVDLGKRGVSLFYVHEKRIRTPMGVDPFRFDLAILSIRSPPGMIDRRVEELTQILEVGRGSEVVCDESGVLPVMGGMERLFKRGVFLDGMNLQERRAVLPLDVGQSSRVLLSDKEGEADEILGRMIVLCGRTGGIRDGEGRAAATKIVRKKLFNAELAQLVAKHEWELRRRAYIEIR